MRCAPVVSLYPQSPLLDSSTLRQRKPKWQRSSWNLPRSPISPQWLTSPFTPTIREAATPPEPSPPQPAAPLNAIAQTRTTCIATPNTSPAILATTPPPAPSAPAHGAKKRRRSNLDDESDSDNEISRNRPSTPKRQRHVPYELPLGLSSTDFYSLHSPPITQSPPSPAQRRLDQRLQEFGARVDPDAPLPSIEEADASAPAPALSADEWSAEEDQRLLQLVLERFRLSQKEWDECARQMGRQTTSDVGRRWHSLVTGGRIGLRSSRR
ncbi:hypothetical protein N7481_005635 [Penicillium waksmanii]|uniref:uncharacterized protein n=1 Tax=Penicillium waksmanii TaxID=69791 RepID=UPI0025470BCE|nr:uncharacterized protein N7481_005635 [Penicillium waksmanii]KAJ5983536.1 hypothetical protein N7481_005635 [Penicillium waksmanii]